ncbi:hypothetical protein [Methylobacterium soli]|uniref:hypothetical protein n=1 Tax=Methylobacterium soli TaxID=553447 RepID=UPI00208A201C|nr:hypothetical protein [Methylobacterium soli]GJE44558.1 Isonitrile hydratase [Methylobacterium soli]
MGFAPGSLYLVVQTPGPVSSDIGISLLATTSFADCPADLDPLFVPGGDGTPAQMRNIVLPLLGAIPVDERVVFDRNRVTAAGISAGLDFALALAARRSPAG